MTDPAERDLASNYAGAFNGSLPFGRRPALLLVDMVMAYLDPASPLYAGEGAREALAAAVQLRKAADARGCPVFFTNVVYQPGGADGGLFYRKVPVLSSFERGNPLGAFPGDLSPSDRDVVVTKQYASGFFGTSLAATLTAQGVDCLLIGGYSTSGCVRATALDAMQNGFAPFVVRDMCADRHPAPHEANLFDLQAKYAEVIALEQALGLLEAR